MADKPAWLSEPELQQVFAAVKQAGGEARAVGGCVRDFLLGKDGADVDMASTLVPDALIELAGQQGWKAVPTGIAHGTVTLVLKNKRVVEVTTLRKDVETDGRHATVEYTDDFEQDASRRDFTINALYMDADGAIEDFFGGRDDLEERRLCFIGDAGERIQEDALRILRYFRFLAQLNWQAETTGRSACKLHRQMLDDLSGERIQQEMKKLLSASHPAHALEQMDKIDLPEHLTGGHWELGPCKFLLQLEAQHKLASHPWLRLAVMLREDARVKEAAHVAQRWKLSRADQDLLEFLCTPHGMPSVADVKRWLLKHPREWVVWRVLFFSARTRQELKEPLRIAQHWQVPTFPVAAKDLMARGMQEGVELGNTLKALEKRWAESDYQLTKDQLLASLSPSPSSV